jgi:xanthine dehydrogenase YagR molybdenum-binding subunit
VADDQVPEVQAPARPNRHAKYPWPDPADSAVIGKPTSRVDGPVKVSGRAKYTYDINRPGMLHGRILRSPHAHARLVSLDLSAAQKAPGVKVVLGMLEPGKKAMYQGDEIAAVAAVTEQQANDLDGAIEAVVTRWLNNYKLAPTFYRFEAISEHPIPTVTHATFGQADREVSEIGESEWR